MSSSLKAQLEAALGSNAFSFREKAAPQLLRTGVPQLDAEIGGLPRGAITEISEDETGIANAIVTPDLFERCRMLLMNEPFLLIEGVLQNLGNVVSVKAARALPLEFSGPVPEAHNFR